ncbi:hypothetical protein ACHAXN_009888 [Cyclotella atomus]
MKQLLFLLTTLLYAFMALALDEDRFLRGRGMRNICIDTGRRTGKQTLEVPKDMRGKCPNNEGKKAIKTLTRKQTKTRLFCRKIHGTLFSTKTIDAATDWMLSNGFEEGKCTERTAATLKLRYVPPEPLTTTNTTEAPKKSKGTETSTDTTEKPKKTKGNSTTDNET